MTTAMLLNEVFIVSQLENVYLGGRGEKPLGGDKNLMGGGYWGDFSWWGIKDEYIFSQWRRASLHPPVKKLLLNLHAFSRDSVPDWFHTSYWKSHERLNKWNQSTTKEKYEGHQEKWTKKRILKNIKFSFWFEIYVHPPANKSRWMKVMQQNIFCSFFFFKNWDSLHARLNSHYKACSYKKKKHKKIKAYRKISLEGAYS